VQFQAPITIATAIDRIENGEYVIPVIQREFVWKTKQIERLFDSLMREYPIGAFLFWEVTKDVLAKYPFFAFSSSVVEAGDNHREKVKATRDKAVGVLDGQQRLTAFLTGLKGSYTGKSKGAAPQHLYLDLLHYDEEAGEEDLAYKFKFMTDAALSKVKDDPASHWFRVGDIIAMAEATEVHDYLTKHQLIAAEGVFRRLEKLRKSVSEVEVINFYLETRDDLGEVLNVFVRLNRSGTSLSYPDLLLSAATVGWKSHSAPAEFKGCVSDMNDQGFQFTRDRVLKAGMVLAGLDDIKFKAANFKADNAIKIEGEWKQIRIALVLAAKLLREFGLDEQTLTAQNVIIPVAYYLKRSARDDKYLSALNQQDDRENIRRFVILTLVKTGFWTGAVDKVLSTTSAVIDVSGAKAFPLGEIKLALANIKKPLPLSDQEIGSLLQAKYAKKSTALILSLLYPIDLAKSHHQDHVVPRARLTVSRLRSLGLSSDEIELATDRRDRLPNLQLLQGQINAQKSKMALTDFIAKLSPVSKRRHFIDSNDLVLIPKDETQFNQFYLKREQVMRKRLRELIK
jgi:hypothetical protein